MKIAITGSNGLLGSTLLKLTPARNFQAFGVSREEFSPSTKSLKKIVDYFRLKQVEVIIHCAANTNVELCETDIEQCFYDNVTLTEVLANVCKILDIKLVFISSTGVYGESQDEPYNEYSDVNPTTAHHKSKLLAERNLSEILNNHLIFRTGWLFGGSRDMQKNFVANRIKEARNCKGSIDSNNNQRGCPTYVNDVADKIFDLLDADWSGIFNCVNSGNASRFEYVSEIIRLAELNIHVNPVQSSSFNRVAKVSNNEMAVNMKLKNIGLDNMPCWKLSLSSYISFIES